MDIFLVLLDGVTGVFTKASPCLETKFTFGLVDFETVETLAIRSCGIQPNLLLKAGQAGNRFHLVYDGNLKAVVDVDQLGPP